MPRYRIIDTAGSDLGIISIDDLDVEEGTVIDSPSGGECTVVEIYDDEHGRDGGVTATLVIDEPH